MCDGGNAWAVDTVGCLVAAGVEAGVEEVEAVGREGAEVERVVAAMVVVIWATEVRAGIWVKGVAGVVMLAGWVGEGCAKSPS